MLIFTTFIYEFSNLLFFISSINQSISIIRHLGCYQTNKISIHKIHLCNAEETTLHLKWNRYFYPLVMQLWGSWNALICSYKWINNVLIHKTLNTDIWSDLKKIKKYCKCEIKTASRWHQVTFNKWVIAIEPNHLKSWFIQERNIVMLLRDAKQCCGCVWNYFCWWNRAKTGNMVSKT